jgi:nitroimidazol reductase NimA-like FMN-containing flavoprotein (pyridoxamine 5'-phosphate oxidase superfamily)
MADPYRKFGVRIVDKTYPSRGVFVKRPAGVIVVAVLMCIGAGLLALGSLAFFALGEAALTAGAEGPMSELFSEMGAFGAGTFLALAVAYAVLAICVFRLVHWAQVAAVVLISVGLGLAAIGVFVSFPHPNLMVFAWQIFVIAVDTWIVWYLTRPHVKRAFAIHENDRHAYLKGQMALRQSEASKTVIRELTKQASLDLLARTHLGRLACTRNGQPYIVPAYFAYHDNCLYSFATVGQKIEWMRTNPLVCVEVDEVMDSRNWASIVVLGRFEELPDGDKWRTARASAHDLLQKKSLWWEPGYVKTILGGTERPLIPVFYRIHIDQITGHRASSDSGNV